MRKGGWQKPQLKYRIAPMYITKSGGKLMETEEQYAETVLARNIPRPILVFFSAPWYVFFF